MELKSSHIEKLDYIPQIRRVAEIFGWQAGIWGSLFIVTALAFVPHSGESWEIFWFSAVIGLVLTAYEIRRHKNRTVLVKEGDQILVFRRGLLDLSLPSNEIRIVAADFHTMLNVGASLGLAALIFTVLGITMIIKDGEWKTDSLLILFWGIGILASLALTIWTRFFCRHLRVGVRGSKWMEKSVLIPSSRFKELFP